MFAKMLLGEPQLLLTKYRPYLTLYDISCDFRSAPHWQMRFLCLVSTANCLHTKFWDKTRSRRGQDEVKTPQDASEKSNMFDPQGSLTTRSRRAKDVLKTPRDGLVEPAHPPRRLAHDSLKTLGSLARRIWLSNAGRRWQTGLSYF